MKFVVSTPEVAHLWANQTQSSAKTANRSFFFEYQTIYSYGSHFPIATIITKGALHYKLITLRSHSYTTSKHISIVRNAANHLSSVYMHYVPYGTLELRDIFTKGINYSLHRDNLRIWMQEIKENVDLLKTARKKEKYINAINSVFAYINSYLSFFNLETPKHLKELMNNVSVEGYNEYFESEAKRIEADEKRAKELQLKDFKETLKNWRNFKVKHMYNRLLDFDYLRYNKDRQIVQTSQSVEIPKDVAIKFYHTVKDVIINGGCNANCTDKIGLFMHRYEVREINKEFIRVGCHKISIKEIENVIKDIL